MKTKIIPYCHKKTNSILCFVTYSFVSSLKNKENKQNNVIWREETKRERTKMELHYTVDSDVDGDNDDGDKCAVCFVLLTFISISFLESKFLLFFFIQLFPYFLFLFSRDMCAYFFLHKFVKFDSLAWIFFQCMMHFVCFGFHFRVEETSVCLCAHCYDHKSWFWIVFVSTGTGTGIFR